jgi:hypothetical protein
MPNVIIFYWAPGSCGDLVQKLFLDNPTDYQGIIQQFSYESTGRMLPKINDLFKVQFNSHPDGWYLRKWTADDCQKIQRIINSLNCNYFIIPTHSLEQVNYLKSQFINCKTMGITYPKNMFPLVLKNWCKKFAPNSDSLNKIYSNPFNQYLKNKGVFGEFILSEKLQYQHNLPEDIPCKFDINFSLENLYNSDLSMFDSVINNKQLIKTTFELWLQKQNQLYCYSFDNLHSILKESLGYNSLAKVPVPLDLKLDLFDNILLKEYCRKQPTINRIPTFINLREANNFFTNANY